MMNPNSNSTKVSCELVSKLRSEPNLNPNKFDPNFTFDPKRGWGLTQRERERERGGLLKEIS